MDRVDKLSQTEIAIAGATSGFLTRALIQPFDVIKIRFQLQVEPIAQNENSKYKTLGQALRLIHKEEGVAAFWKGHVPAQVLSISFGLMQFWCFETLVKQAKKYHLYHHRALANFLCGAAAGSTATLVCFPIDIVKTRLIAQSDKTRIYSGLYSGLLHIVLHEGPLGLYKGLTPTLIAITPNIGCQFMFYKFFDDIHRDLIVNEPRYNIIGSFISGSLAGFCSKTLLYPFDITRRRMQIQGFQKYRKSFGASFVCSSMVNCIIKTYKFEGVCGLFKGITPSTLKALIASGINFTVFEMVSDFLSS